MFVTFISLFSLFINYISVTGAVIQEFYWRDYVPGDIPYDALEASNGRYIGQVNYNGDNLVGTIYPYNYQAVIEMSKKIIIKNNIKILCTQECSRFYWEIVDFTRAHEQQMKNAVKGGFQSDRNLFIGKLLHQGEWRIGKVEEINHSSKGLWIWNNGGSPYNVNEFYLLKYNTTLGNGCVTP